MPGNSQRDTEWETLPAEKKAAILTAHYFNCYLQEKRKLKSVVQDFKKLIPGSRSGQSAKDSIKILEDHFGNTIDRIDGDFMEWFTKIEK
jgi:hypothetical protein